MTQFEKLSRSITHPSPPAVQLRDEELDVFAIFRLVRRRILLVVFVFVLVVAGALPLILSLQNPYFAQSRLLLQRPLTTGLATPGEQDAFDLDTELQRLLSRDIAVRVIDEFDLASRPEFNPPLRPVPPLERLRANLRRWIKGEATAPPAAVDGMQPVIGTYLDALSVWRNGQSQVVDVGFRSFDPELAAGVANRLVEIYLDEREQRQRARLGAADGWFAAQVDEQRGRVVDAERAITRFRRLNGLASDAQGNVTSTIATLNARRAALATERATIGARLAGLEAAARPADAAEFVDTEAMGQLRRESQLELQELSKLLARYGNAHEAVVAARSRIADTEAAIEGEVARYIQTLRAQVAALDREDATVKAGSDEARAALAKLDQAEAGLETLRDRADQERQALDGIEQRRRALQSQRELPVAEVEVLSPAAVPLYPQGRGRGLYLIAAMVAAGGLAFTMAVIAELLDRGVRSSQQLERAGIFHAGMIPRVPVHAANLTDLLRLQPDGMFADSIRGLALALERAGGGKMPHSITVTSALPGDGKSLIAVSLALELAAGGRRVLLVDGDLRRGVVHAFFGVPAEPGLADVLSGARDLADVVRRHEESGLEYVPRGRLRAISHQEQQQASRLIEHARANGQIVIFDSAPVLATSGTSVLAGLSDRTVLAVRWGRTTPRIIDLALQRLLAASGDDVAVTINMVNPRRHALYAFSDAGVFSPQLRKYYPTGL